MPIKRVIDVVGAAVALSLFAPVMLLVAMLVRLDSPGPLLFRQQRSGRAGRPFTIHKFRTLRDGAAPSPVTPDGDPRVTRVGDFLRRWKLDELPQLFDVLAGHMSLVGPRPELAENLASIKAGDRREILSFRPGLTGPAAVAFLAEDAVLADRDDPVRDYRERILPSKVGLELDYVRNWSIRRDLRLILGTLTAVWTPGARRRSRLHIESLLELDPADDLAARRDDRPG